jgi:F0F1-type ATP synthase membrane subunit b/b'
MEIFHQLGELFLQAAPTVVIVLLFYFFMRWAFWGPIQKAMAERTAKMEGARTEAAAVEASARQELDTYQQALNKARGEVYAEQETARQAALDERARLLKAMNARAQEDVAAAKKKIAADIAAARGQVELDLPGLANDIARRILEKPSTLRGGTA